MQQLQREKQIRLSSESQKAPIKYKLFLIFSLYDFFFFYGHIILLILKYQNE